MADFIRTKFGCFEVVKTTGTIYGKIDVVGLRYSVGRRGGSAEAIAVEVKPGISNLLKALGQAVGYSVMAARCYLAVYDPAGKKIGQIERELAAQLNLGLISTGRSMRPEVLLSSPKHTPLRLHRIALLRSIGFIECVLCESFWPATNMTLQSERITILKALQARKGFRYSLPALTKQRQSDSSSSDLRYFCGDCVAAFSGLALQSK